MGVSLVRIGNSQGVRIPRTVLALYQWDEGTALEFETRHDGLLIRPVPGDQGKLSFEAAYAERAIEVAEKAEWDEWDALAGEGAHG